MPSCFIDQDPSPSRTLFFSNASISLLRTYRAGAAGPIVVKMVAAKLDHPTSALWPRLPPAASAIAPVLQVAQEPPKGSAGSPQPPAAGAALLPFIANAREPLLQIGHLLAVDRIDVNFVSLGDMLSLRLCSLARPLPRPENSSHTTRRSPISSKCSSISLTA